MFAATCALPDDAFAVKQLNIAKGDDQGLVDFVGLCFEGEK